MITDSSQTKWFHSIDLKGEVTAGAKSREVLEAEARVVFKDGVAGKTVLDVGAWDGFFSFEAERLGASRVLATDHISWSGWGWGTKDGFDYARGCLESEVEFLDIDVPDISPDTVGMWDTVLFLGVLYHLKNPYAGLETVSRVTGKTLIVDTVTALNDLPEPAARYFFVDELARDRTNYWGPNTRCVELMLREIGFSRVELFPSPSWPPNVPGISGIGRHIAFAYRD